MAGNAAHDAKLDGDFDGDNDVDQDDFYIMVKNWSSGDPPSKAPKGLRKKKP